MQHLINRGGIALDVVRFLLVLRLLTIEWKNPIRKHFRMGRHCPCDSIIASLVKIKKPERLLVKESFGLRCLMGDTWDVGVPMICYVISL